MKLAGTYLETSCLVVSFYRARRCHENCQVRKVINGLTHDGPYKLYDQPTQQHVSAGIRVVWLLWELFSAWICGLLHRK